MFYVYFYFHLLVIFSRIKPVFLERGRLQKSLVSARLGWRSALLFIAMRPLQTTQVFNSLFSYMLW